MSLPAASMHRRAAHHHRARAVGAEPLAHIVGRAVKDAGDARPSAGRARRRRSARTPSRRPARPTDEPTIDRDAPVGCERQPRVLARPGRAALDVAADRAAVIAPVDQPALLRRLAGPVELREAAIERCRIVAAVGLGLDVERHHGREPVGHRAFRDQVAPAQLDAVDAEIVRHHVDQPLAEEIGLVAARPAIGADRRLVGDDERDLDADIGDTRRARRAPGRCCARASRRRCAHRRRCRRTPRRAAPGTCRRGRRRSRARSRRRARGCRRAGSRGGPRSIAPAGRSAAPRTGSGNPPDRIRRARRTRRRRRSRPCGSRFRAGPIICASMRRLGNAILAAPNTVSLPAAASHCASSPRGSIGTAVKRCTLKRSRRT